VPHTSEQRVNEQGRIPKIDSSDYNNNVSRASLLQEMEKLGINTSALESLTLQQLSDLLYGMNKIASMPVRSGAKAGNKAHEAGATAIISLSAVDKKMLKMMLASNGNTSSIALSRELNVPLTTVQRRRKRLSSLIHSSYSLEWKKFGMRSMMFFITTENVAPSTIAKEIMSWPEVAFVTRMFSSNGADLMVQAILKTNKEVVDFSERIRVLGGVKEVFWNEPIEIIGKNDDVYLKAIDSL
jgi:DNA-binding Lrp family transcriptional regulator